MRDARRLILIPAGSFQMGCNADEGEPGDGEAPARSVQLSAYPIERTTVSNTDYAQFVSATGYVTLAEESERVTLSPDCCRMSTRQHAASPRHRGGTKFLALFGIGLRAKDHALSSAAITQ